jgi:hypothetical protein
MSSLLSSEDAVKEDNLWQVIRVPVGMGKTDARKVDEYLYASE